MPRQIVLASRPSGWPTAANFALTEADRPGLDDGQIRVRNLFMSVDPYMRGRMNDARSTRTAASPCPAPSPATTPPSRLSAPATSAWSSPSRETASMLHRCCSSDMDAPSILFPEGRRRGCRPTGEADGSCEADGAPGKNVPKTGGKLGRPGASPLHQPGFALITVNTRSVSWVSPTFARKGSPIPVLPVLTRAS
jgi:N-terminal domain of oxidoreductase